MIVRIIRCLNFYVTKCKPKIWSKYCDPKYLTATLSLSFVDSEIPYVICISQGYKRKKIHQLDYVLKSIFIRLRKCYRKVPDRRVVKKMWRNSNIQCEVKKRMTWKSKMGILKVLMTQKLNPNLVTVRNSSKVLKYGKA